ncbi:hypothetical protein ACH4GM_31760 [Streptomyces coeruleorubidus]|uniref:hypothetical protein n=1 Tax=Streptomyces coeruleorubidus TaxID=116188 RepID=UPI0037B8F91D
MCQIDPSGGVLAIAPDQVTEWLAPLPVDARHSIGPRQAATLREYGIHSVGETGGVHQLMGHGAQIAVVSGGLTQTAGLRPVPTSSCTRAMTAP